MTTTTDTRYTPVDHEARKALVRDDLTPTENAELLGLKYATFMWWAEDQGIEVTPAHVIKKQRRIARIQDLITQGLDREEIAKDLGITAGTIERWASTHGLTLPYRRRALKSTPERLEYLARSKAARKGLRKTRIAHRAIAFREWTPAPSMYHGISPHATARWTADCHGCRWTEPADDEQHARSLADQHNRTEH